MVSADGFVICTPKVAQQFSVVFNQPLMSLCGFRNPGVHWKRRGHRGEEEDTEEDLTKDMDDSSAGASMEEGSMSKNSK